MPPVRSIQLSSTRLTVIDKAGTKTLLATSVPSTQNTPEKIETWVNTWLAANLVDYQARVHVFSLSPLLWTIGTWNAGLAIPANWWADA